MCVLGAGLSALADEEFDPFDAKTTAYDPFDTNGRTQEAYDPFERYAGSARNMASSVALDLPRRDTIAAPRQVNFQNRAADSAAEVNPPAADPSSVEAPRAALKDPCAAAAEKPFFELGIGIDLPTGRLPTDHAAACWESVNAMAGPLAGSRFWTEFGYQWDSACLCHRPLYFEEINLERYGYGCHDCLQPAASAAHFFGTVPALPYLMAARCPQECVYTLGHYRPGSCPPWRHHWPPCDGLAAAAQAGVLTGLIFLIP
jgi:hypothetical protein